MRPEEIAERFEVLLARQAAVVNELADLHTESGEPVSLVDDTCCIDPSAYMDVHGGPYASTGYGSVAYDCARVFEAELKQCGILSRDGEFEPRVAQFRGVPDESCTVYAEWCATHEEPRRSEGDDVWALYCAERLAQQRACFGTIIQKQEKEEAQKASMHAELAVLAMLQKALGDAYLVVRAAPTDDYFAHVDTVVMDRRTGRVVCTFDELYDDRAADRPRHGQDRFEEKLRRAREKMERGAGFSLTYGLSVEARDAGRCVVRAPVRDVPAFPVRVRRTDLDALIQNGDVFGDVLTERERDALIAMLTEARDIAREQGVHSSHAERAATRVEHIETLLRAIEKDTQS